MNRVRIPCSCRDSLPTPRSLSAQSLEGHTSESLRLFRKPAAALGVNFLSALALATTSLTCAEAQRGERL